MSIRRISIPFIALVLLAACAAEPDMETVPPGAEAPGPDVGADPADDMPPPVGDPSADDPSATDPPADDPQAGDPPADEPADEPPADEPPADSPEPEAWVVSFGGVGPLDLGMTLEEAAAALGQESLEVSGPTPACGYVLPPATPDGIAAMIVDDHVVRIDIMEGPTPTEAGARIGDTEARIRALYEGRVEEAPHKYVDGSYLTVSPPGGDSTHRILFETEGTTVTTYRTGLLPQVRWVEGCS